jgi:hypothetical protein
MFRLAVRPLTMAVAKHQAQTRRTILPQIAKFSDSITVRLIADIRNVKYIFIYLVMNLSRSLSL